MTSNPHFHHPLYAFLQSDSRKIAERDGDEGRTSSSQSPIHGHLPLLRNDKLKTSIDEVLTKHLISLVATVREHSTQLDQMVAHVNSLVRRVESIETIFNEGQELIQQLVAEFKTDADRIAVQTGDRINHTIEPLLKSFNNSFFSLNAQLENIRSHSDQQNNIQSKNHVTLAKLEKELEHLACHVNQLESRSSDERRESFQKLDNLRNQVESLNSALAPIRPLAPLLQAILESELHSCQNATRSRKSFRSCDPNCPVEHIAGRMTTTRRSSVAQMIRVGEQNSASVRNPESPQIQDESNYKSTTRVNCDVMHDASGEEQINISHAPALGPATPENGTEQGDPGLQRAKAEGENEPMMTQATDVPSGQEAHVESKELDEEMLKTNSQAVERCQQLKRRRSTLTEFSQIQLSGEGQTSSQSTFTNVITMTHSRKRTRSIKHPDEFKQTQSPANSTVLARRRSSSHKTTLESPVRSQDYGRSEIIDKSEELTIHFNKPIKQNRRALILKENPDTDEE